MPRLLIVEDEERLLRHLQKGLQEDGYDVLTASDGEAGLDLATTESVDLVIVDLMLPIRDGLTIVRDIRARGIVTPVLILTAKDSVSDRVMGLDCGADDYLVKPFAFEELVARIRALLRRKPAEEATVLRAGDLEMNLLTRNVVRGTRQLDLSTREYELLYYFLCHVDEVLPRETIARDVWKEPGPVETNVIDVYVNYLRKKIDIPGRPMLIRTIRGVGYCLESES
ncbi:MAG: response regulator transcription factor [Planctomycetaceae bacterium]